MYVYSRPLSISNDIRMCVKPCVHIRSVEFAMFDFVGVFVGDAKVFFAAAAADANTVAVITTTMPLLSFSMLLPPILWWLNMKIE